MGPQGVDQAGHLTRIGRERYAEVHRLRAENKRLLQERDLLKKAAAFFARNRPEERLDPSPVFVFSGPTDVHACAGPLRDYGVRV